MVGDRTALLGTVHPRLASGPVLRVILAVTPLGGIAQIPYHVSNAFLSRRQLLRIEDHERDDRYEVERTESSDRRSLPSYSRLFAQEHHHLMAAEAVDAHLRSLRRVFEWDLLPLRFEGHRCNAVRANRHLYIR